MKKQLLSLLFLMPLLIGPLFGQISSPKGKLTVSPTIGLRNPGATVITAQGGGIYTFPAVVYVDYGLSEMISVGGLSGLRVVSCKTCSEEITGAFVSLGVRVNGHLFPILKKTDVIEEVPVKWDVYLSLMGGAELNSNLNMVPRITMGARYSVRPKIALMMEFGHGFLSLFNFGATFQVN